MQVAPTPCPICQAQRRLAVPFHVNPQVEDLRREMGDSAPYGWFLCENCGNAAPSRQPDRAVLEAYWHTNREVSAGDDADALWEYRRAISEIGARRTWDSFAPLMKGGQQGRFLDIACGMGVTVRYFADRGWHAVGVDTNRELKRYHDELGIDTRIGQVENLEFDGKFDLVQIAYALYFITDPVAFLGKIRHHIKDTGHVCLVMADLLSYRDSGGPSYLHTIVTTEESVKNLLSLAGYRVVKTLWISDSLFVAAEIGDSQVQPPPIGPILWRHRSRSWRYALAGRPRQFLARHLKSLAAKVRAAFR
jgi:SAM-dependent methyltransferase